MRGCFGGDTLVYSILFCYILQVRAAECEVVTDALSSSRTFLAEWQSKGRELTPKREEWRSSVSAVLEAAGAISSRRAIE